MEGCRRLLIISAPTLDIIERVGGWVEVRPGGPAAYAGTAAVIEGLEVYALGPVGSRTLWTVRVEDRLGVRRVLVMRAGGGMVFHHHIRKAGGRRSRLLSRSPPLGKDEILSALRDVKPHIVIVSPVWGEVPPGAIPLLHGPTRITAVDAQGFHRASLTRSLPEGRWATILHGTGEELRDAPPDAASIVAWTNGPGPMRIIEVQRGNQWMLQPPGGLLEDPTGAGDVFTFYMAYLICKGEPPKGAALEAAGRTVERLPRIQAELRGASCWTQGLRPSSRDCWGSGR